MIRINLLNDLVQFTLTGTPKEKVKEKEFFRKCFM